MFEKVLQLLSIHCRHKKTSQPFTAAVSASSNTVAGEWESVGTGASHYIVCLDCGKKFAYDWEHMRRLG
jgi:predicted transcriptional regulator